MLNNCITAEVNTCLHFPKHSHNFEHPEIIKKKKGKDTEHKVKKHKALGVGVLDKGGVKVQTP